MRKIFLLFSLLLGFAGVSASVSVASAQAAGVPASTETASLLMSTGVHARPSASSPQISVVAGTRPVTGSQTVLPVLSSADHSQWLQVLLPQRPDGASGWISANAVVIGHTPWYIVVDRASREASVYDRGRLAQRFPVIVGKPSTPTPSGHFFVAEVVHEGYGIVSGPYALATSAYSNVYQEFEGGPGQVALHGIVGLDDPIGTASSHGCVRFEDAAITWLAARATAGTPIDII